MHGPNRSFHFHEHEWNELSTSIIERKPNLTTICAGQPPTFPFRVNASFEFFQCTSYCCSQRKHILSIKSFFNIIQNCLPFISIYYSYRSYGCSEFSYICGSILNCGCIFFALSLLQFSCLRVTQRFRHAMLF